MSDAAISDLEELRPFRRVLCQDRTPGCPTRQLGPGSHVQLDLLGICGHGLKGSQGDGLYSCNRSVTPACAELCGEGPLRLEDFQGYLDEVLSTNPFEGMDEPWDVPQVDLTLPRAFIFLSQRQALYVALRTLALKMQNPQSNATNALDYGLTRGCNWRPVPPGVPEPSLCDQFPPYSGVDSNGLQGNIFSLLAWAQALAIENGARLGRKACFWRQKVDALLWCPHDSVIAAVRGGKSGPDTRASLDTDVFWSQHNVSLREVGVRPNVCHFEASRWVWNNSMDEEQTNFCRGAWDVPEVYSPEVEDFMSRDRPWSVAVDIAGAQYGGGCSSASGQTWGTQDESTPVFFPESLALGFHSTGRSLGTGRTALLFLGVRRYFSGQSGSHGKDRRGLKRPLFVSGNMCGSLQHARPLTASKLLTESGVVRLERTFPVRMFAHSLGVITSSCGTCEDGNLPNSTLKFRTAGETCLVSWQGGQSRCERSSKGWTYWQDVWTWIGAFDPAFYPLAARPAITKLVRRIATGPWGAGVWWGNTLQYFAVVWIATMLLWHKGAGPQLDYYAYGAPDQPWPPLGGFCEQYQAQGYEDVVKNLPLIDQALGQDVSIKFFIHDF